MSLPAPGETLRQMIRGPAGLIETQLDAPRAGVQPVGCALICHPHPLYGGALSNKVTYSLASCASRSGWYALRFNFRGVGRSEGLHDEGRGETDDAVFLAHWLREQWPDAPLALMGFSFGAFIALHAAARVPAQLCVSIAPPFAKYVQAPPPPRPAAPWLVVHGRDDEIVSYNDTLAALERYQPPPELVSCEGTGHFFHGQLKQIEEAVLPFLHKNAPTAL